MSDLYRVVRGYRPGRRSLDGPNVGGRESVRLANLERYVLRAQAGLPIFDDADEAISLSAFAAKSSLADSVSI